MSDAVFETTLAFGGAVLDFVGPTSPGEGAVIVERSAAAVKSIAVEERRFTKGMATPRTHEWGCETPGCLGPCGHRSCAWKNGRAS